MFVEMLFISNSPNEVNIFDIWINSPNIEKKLRFSFQEIAGYQLYICTACLVTGAMKVLYGPPPW